MLRRFSLDERDARMLRRLDLDARATLASLAKELRISKPAAKRRLERLETEGIIRRYIAIINPSMLGYTTYKVHLRVINMDDQERERFAIMARDLPEVGWVLTTIGNWDFILLLFAQDAYSLGESYRKLLAPISGNVARKSIGVVSRIVHLTHDCLLSKKEPRRGAIDLKGNGQPVPLDRLDARLLDLLSKDGRASLVKMAAHLSVTPKTVKSRMKALEKRGVIVGYNTVLDTSKAGYEHHKISVHMSHLGGASFTKLRGYAESLPETVLITEALGAVDFEFDVKVPGTSRLHLIVQELRDKFKGVVRDVETLLITDENIVDYTPYL